MFRNKNSQPSRKSAFVDGACAMFLVLWLIGARQKKND